jgi:hypothetical protein
LTFKETDHSVLAERDEQIIVLRCQDSDEDEDAPSALVSQAFIASLRCQDSDEDEDAPSALVSQAFTASCNLAIIESCDCLSSSLHLRLHFGSSCIDVLLALAIVFSIQSVLGL